MCYNIYTKNPKDFLEKTLKADFYTSLRWFAVYKKADRLFLFAKKKGGGE